ncbi:uncharacterized protein F4807DRAFT_18476 [Annulohypoxylon truncatum]|uniref:uncharacterized protein n=1 Tax=Annulohypoxylon truncatum TaxID=327061 RepID=UPI00200735B3|nr:uncharacterized protein F4807DRAFT_18476 [Annulohypoxylon truncatum]KAI1215034.1 hypothetical protein F4807DRAFT_18476 [Annulohypoxylon truncatum]
MDSTNQGYVGVCARRPPVTRNEKQLEELRASQFAGFPENPRQSRISQRLSGTGEDNPSSPSTVTKSLETVTDTRDGPRKLETQTNSQLEVTWVTPVFVLHLRLWQKSKNPSRFEIVSVQIIQNAPKNDHPADQAEVDGTGDNRTRACSSSNSQNLGSSSSAANKRQGNFKRQRNKKNRGDPPERRGGRRSSASRHIDESQQYFACPFYYSDKVEHWHCHRFAFKRIGDVRQHIKRTHIVPIHCPVCGENFDNNDLKDVHVDARVCQQHEFPHSWATIEQLDSMDRAANELNPSSDRERWFTIWDIMFPDTQQPASPYICDTYWGFQASVTQDAVNEYRRQERYQQVTGQQTYLGDNVLNDFLSFLNENSLGLTPTAPHPPHPSNHPTTLSLGPLEPFPLLTMPSILSQTSQIDIPNFSQNQPLDFTPSFLTNSYQTPYITFNDGLDENDNEFENIINSMLQPGGHDNSQL